MKRLLLSIIAFIFISSFASAQDVLEANANEANNVLLIKKELESTTPIRINGKGDSQLFIDTLSFNSWAQSSRLKNYGAAIQSVAASGSADFSDPIFSRAIVFSGSSQVIFVATLNDKAMDISATEAYDRLQKFYVEDCLQTFSRAAETNRTGTPIDAITGILVINTNSGFVALLRSYGSIGYGAGEDFYVYTLNGSSVYRLSLNKQSKISDLVAVNPTAAIAAMKKKKAEASSNVVFQEFSKDLNRWYGHGYPFAETYDLLKSITSPEELRSLDTESILSFLGRWLAAIGGPKSPVPPDAREELFGKMREAATKTIKSPFVGDLSTLQFDVSSANIENVAFTALSGFGANWAYYKTNTKPSLKTKDIEVLKKYPLSSDDLVFISTHDLTNINSLSDADRFTLATVISHVNMEDIAKTSESTYTQLFTSIEAFAMLRKEILKEKSKYPIAWTSLDSMMIPGLTSEEETHYLDLVLKNYPTRLADILRALPEKMIDPNFVPFGSEMVW